MKRVHIPNLFYIQGQSYQGKSTLAWAFRQSLDCEVIATDKLCWRWCAKNYFNETTRVRKMLGTYFPSLSETIRRQWFEYMTNHILSRTCYARPDLILEGWLLALLPKDLRRVLKHSTTIFPVTMNHFVAMAANKSFKSVNGNYTQVVAALRACLRTSRERELMSQVMHQNFEDCGSCVGRSNTAGRLAVFRLPDDLRKKRVLEINCNTGYFGIRLAQRGASVWAVDENVDNVRLASQIANVIYRLPNIKFYSGNILNGGFRKTLKFDYIIMLNGFNKRSKHVPLFECAQRMLAPNGRILAEIVVPTSDDTCTPLYKEMKVRDAVLYCPNNATINSWADNNLILRQRDLSVPISSHDVIRTACTFQLGVTDGLDNRYCNSGSYVPNRSEEQVGLVDTVIQSDDLDVFNTDERLVGASAGVFNNRRSQFEELFDLEKL